MPSTLAEPKMTTHATERVVVLMTPADKRRLEEKAKAAQLSIGEFVRRAVDAYDPSGEEAAEIDVVLGKIKEMGDEILERLDAATAQVRATRAHLAAGRCEP